MVTEHFLVDMNDIVCTGNSRRDTTYYAACLDERIKIAAPSCSVCNLKTQCRNAPLHVQYVPGMQYFEMGDGRNDCTIAG